MRYISFSLSGAEEEEVEADAAAVVEIEDAEVAVEIEDAEAAEVEAAAAAAIEIIKTPVVILARTWTISNLNTLDMDIESVIRIIEMREGIREAEVAVVVAVVVAVAVAEVEEVEAIAEIPARTTLRIIVKVTVRIINNRSILAKETRMEMTIEAAGTIIRTGGKAGEEEGGAEFKVDGIKVAIIPVEIAISAVATTGAEAGSTEDATLHIFLCKSFSREEKKKAMINIKILIVVIILTITYAYTHTRNFGLKNV